MADKVLDFKTYGKQWDRGTAHKELLKFFPASGENNPLNCIEAEQALLGIVLFAPDAFLAVDGDLGADDFAEPFHQRLWARIATLLRIGRLADPVTLARDFAVDPAFHDLGGIRYLADLVDRAPPAANAKDYGKVVRSTALRRDTIRIAIVVGQRALDDNDATGADLMAQMESELLAVRGGGGGLELENWRDVSSRVVYGMTRPEERPLLKTGLAKVDEATGGFERGDLIVMGARPSMGKSALAGCISLNVATAGLGVVEINGEMSTDQMARRHLTDRAFELFKEEGPAYRDIRRRRLTDRQVEVLHEVDHDLAALPLKMIKRTGLTMGHLRALLRRQKMVWEDQGVPLSLVVVDHVGLIKADERTSGRTEEQTLISAGLKALGDELDVVVLALAQLNRNVEARDDKRPQLADLRDSGSWEQDADVVMGIYRDAYYARREREPKGMDRVAEWTIRCGSPWIEAIMLKVREGDVATAKLWADIGRNAIRDLDPNDQGFDFGVARGLDFSGGYQPR